MSRRIAALLLSVPVLVRGEACLSGDDQCESDTTSMLQTKAATALLEQLESGIPSDEAEAPVGGESDEPETELKLTAPKTRSLALGEATLQCIHEKFMAMQVPEVLEKLRGQGQDPATICASVPGSGFFKGYQGPDYKQSKPRLAYENGWLSSAHLSKKKKSGGSGIGSLFGLNWKGKTLKACQKEGVNGTCEERALTNTLEWKALVTFETEAYNGHWTTKPQSWIDGQPCAQILYPQDMKEAIDELRPWCTCGVRTWLGVLLWKTDADPEPVPLRSFLLIPPTAAENDCPSSQRPDTMCV